MICDKTKLETIIKWIYGNDYYLVDQNLKEVEKEFEYILRTLTPREEYALLMRFGMHDDYEGKQTYRKIGDIFDVTGQWATAIINKAKRRLQHPSRWKKLSFMIGHPETDKLIKEDAEREHWLNVESWNLPIPSHICQHKTFIKEEKHGVLSSKAICSQCNHQWEINA